MYKCRERKSTGEDFFVLTYIYLFTLYM